MLYKFSNLTALSSLLRNLSPTHMSTTRSPRILIFFSYWILEVTALFLATWNTVSTLSRIFIYYRPELTPPNFCFPCLPLSNPKPCFPNQTCSTANSREMAWTSDRRKIRHSQSRSAARRLQQEPLPDACKVEPLHDPCTPSEWVEVGRPPTGQDGHIWEDETYHPNTACLT